MGFEIAGEAIAEEIAADATIDAATGEAIAAGYESAVAEGASVTASEGIGLGTVVSAAGRALISSGITELMVLAQGRRLNRTETSQGTLVNSLTTVDPIPVIYGTRRVGATVCPVGVSGSALEFLHLICVWGEGPISAIGTVYLDGRPATDAIYAGLVTREDFLGTDGQAASATLVAAFADASRWNTSCTLAGIAYTYLILKWDQTAFAKGKPLVTADVNGRTLFDPRTSTTGFSRNPWLAIRDWMTNPRYGRGNSSGVIDDTSFAGEARHADDLVSIPGGTQARYTCDGVLNPDDAPLDNLKALLSSCRGSLIYSGGKYKAVSDRIQPITISRGYESSTWVAGAVAPTGYALNQDLAGESTFAVRTGPYGGSEIVNVCQSLDTPAGDPGPDGGWTMNPVIAVDKTKPYLFACFFKRLSTGTPDSGQMYWGLNSNSVSAPYVLDLAGTTNPNPYFYFNNVTVALPTTDKWYLAVGFVHENGYGTTDTNISGVYDAATGTRILAGVEYKWPADATLCGHRAYHYYNQTISGEIQQMARPVVIQCAVASAPAVIAALLDGPTSGGFALSEDNILGAWSWQQPGRRTRFNAVKARFYDPATNYLPNITVWPPAGGAQSVAYLAQDNALVLSSQLELPFTANLYTAQQICQIETKKSRQPLLVSLNATIAAMALEVGDIVPVAHSTPGWPAAGDPAEGKLFRVEEVELFATDEVRLGLRLYDAAAYSLDALTLQPSLTLTSLPDGITVAAPGAPAVAESLYQTASSAGVKSRATVSWGASADQFVQSGGWYQLERSTAGAGVWTIYPRLQSPGLGVATVSFPVDDVAAGTYDWRVAAFNTLGAKSAYSPTSTKEIFGLNTPPSNVANFTVQSYAGQAKFTWDKPSTATDLAVVAAGRIYVRWSPKTAAASWDNGSLVNPDGYPGDTSIGFGPLMTGTYMAKMWNGRAYSAVEATFVATEALVSGLTTLATVSESPAFPGAKSNVAAVDSGIQLDGTTLIDAMLTNIDTWSAIDSLGGVQGSGSYTFAAALDLGAKQVCRLFSSIDSVAYATDDMVDSRTDPIDAWGLVDGVVIEDAEVSLWVRHTDDDPAGAPVWSAYERLGLVGDYNFRAFGFRLDFATGSPTHNRQVTALSVTAKH